MSDQAITGVCVVAQPSSCPPGYLPITHTYETNEDADLWREGGIFSFSRTYRYICVSRASTDASGTPLDVLADVALIGERDPAPEGFRIIPCTEDTRDRAMRKKQLCVKFVPRMSVVSCITDIIFLSSRKRPPNGFTIVGDLNGLYLCYKIGRLTALPNSNNLPTPNNLASGLTPSNSKQHLGGNGSGRQTPQFQRQVTVSTHPMSHVPFALAKRAGSVAPQSQFNYRTLYKTSDAIDREYNCDFSTEETVLRQC